MKVIAGNWKMNLLRNEALVLIKSIKKELNKSKNAIIVCPPFAFLYEAGRELEGSNIKIGAQNMHFAESGAYTGETSPLMLKDAGCSYVIVGHSERRIHFKEDNEIIGSKVESAIKHALIPILCVGERLEERENRIQNETVKAQLLEGLKNINSDKIKNIVIAYEPVWAIGTGKNATPEQADKMHRFIKDIIAKKYGKGVKAIYGGSVNPENSSALLGQPNIDGVLVGGASIKSESFVKIANYS